MRILGACTVVVAGSRDERIATIAARQRGRISRRQLSDAGIERGAIRARVGAGRLIEQHPGVFAVGHGATVQFGDETAALLACGDGAVLSHLSAALVWDLTPAPPLGTAAPALGTAAPPLGTGAPPLGTEIHVTVPRGRGPSLPGVRVHRARVDAKLRHGLPVTSPARTPLDIATLLPERSLELAYDRALVARLTTPGEVRRAAARARGHHGCTPLERLLDATPTTVTRSEAEERVLALIRGAQLPPPAVNCRVHDFEVDFYWPRQRLVLEVDGFRFHSTRRAFEHDRRKGAALAAAGILVIRVTWRQIESEPLAVVARLAQALARAVAA